MVLYAQEPWSNLPAIVARTRFFYTKYFPLCLYWIGFWANLHVCPSTAELAYVSVRKGIDKGSQVEHAESVV